MHPFTRVRLLRIFNVAGMFPILSSYRIIVKALCEGAWRTLEERGLGRVGVGDDSGGLAGRRG